MEKKKYFLREATGLVREAGLLDMIQLSAVSLTGVSIIAGSMLLLPLITSAIWQAITIAFVTAIPVLLVYCILSASMPRTGGDYIYISRLLHPSLGVVAAGVFGIFAQIIFFAWGTTWVSAGLSPLLLYIGNAYNDPGLIFWSSEVLKPHYLLVMGILTTLVWYVIIAFGGLRAFFRINNVLYAIATIGMLAGAWSSGS